MADEVTRPPIRIDARKLGGFITRLFAAAGLSQRAASQMSEALIEADLAGLSSHGVMQAEIYLKRLQRGSVTPREEAEIVLDRDATAVLDAHHMMGHLSGRQAMDLAISKARRFGVGVVAVRHGFHFGAAGRYVQQAADAGCVGMAMANARPTMPGPGGADRLVGTNPLAISVPTGTPPSIVVDMATSAGTVGRIRLAQKAGRKLPQGWAVTETGEPTDDPAAALKGMLLPMGGHKGFGLSLAVDLLSGLLASGSWGDANSGLHLNLDKPFDSSHLFIAIDVEHFRALDEFLDEADKAAERVRKSKPAPGNERMMTPGQRKWETIRNGDGTVKLEAEQVDALTRLASELGVDAAELKGA